MPGVKASRRRKFHSGKCAHRRYGQTSVPRAAGERGVPHSSGRGDGCAPMAAGYRTLGRCRQGVSSRAASCDPSRAVRPSNRNARRVPRRADARHRARSSRLRSDRARITAAVAPRSNVWSGTVAGRIRRRSPTTRRGRRPLAARVCPGCGAARGNPSPTDRRTARECSACTREPRLRSTAHAHPPGAARGTAFG